MTDPQQTEPRRFYDRPINRTFEAYRAFIVEMVRSLGGEPTMGEEELRKAWRDFWAAAGEPTE